MELRNYLVGRLVHHECDVAPTFVGLLNCKLLDPCGVRFIPGVNVAKVELPKFRVRKGSCHIHLVNQDLACDCIFNETALASERCMVRDQIDETDRRNEHHYAGCEKEQFETQAGSEHLFVYSED